MNIQKRLHLLQSGVLQLISNIKPKPLLIMWASYSFFAFILLFSAYSAGALRNSTRVDTKQDLTEQELANEVFWGLEVIPPDQNEDNKPSFLLKTVEVSIPRDSEILPDQFCLDELYYYENAFLDRQAYSAAAREIQGIENPPVCLILENTNLDITFNGQPYWLFRFMAEESTPIELQAASGPVVYYYPYDGFNSDITFQARYRINGQGKEIRSGMISPRLGISNFLLRSNWDIKVSSSEHKSDEIISHPIGLYNLDRLDKYNVLVLRYDRPFVSRLVYPIIFISMFVFVVMISTLEDMGTFIQGSAGVLFGIFGARSVLIDIPIPQGRTITDILFMLLYLAFAISVFAFVLRQMVRNKTNSN